MEGQIKCFQDKIKLKKFITTKPLLFGMSKGLSKKKKIKNMNSEMAKKTQLLTTEVKKNEQSKQTTRTGTESQKWKSHGGLSVGKWEGERGEKGNRE